MSRVDSEPLSTGARSTARPSSDPSSSGSSSSASKILDATVAVLAREGIAGVTMRAVAREAGVAVGLASYHFDNKTALVAAALRRIGEADEEIVAPKPGDPSERLRQSLRRALDPAFLTPDYLGLRLQLWSLAGVDPVYAEINHHAQERYLERLAGLLAAARPDLEADEVARRSADILVQQNGVWLTSILIADAEATARALARTEALAFE